MKRETPWLRGPRGSDIIGCMRSVRCVVAAAVAVVFADGCRKSGGGDPSPVVTAIAVSPADALLSLTVGESASEGFTATASYDDGTDADVTSEVVWSLASPGVGAFTGATLQVAPLDEPGAVGSVVTATLGDVSGSGYVTVVAVGSADTLVTLPSSDAVSAELTMTARAPDAADVFFVVDATGSMGGEIVNLQNAFASTIVPAIAADVPNARFGVAAFMDFPVAPYGNTDASATCTGAEAAADQPLKVRQVLTTSQTAAAAGIGSLRTSTAPIGCGGDLPESMIEALYLTATGDALSAPSPTLVPASNLGFRDDALKVLITVSDIASHAPGEATSCNGTSVDYGGAVLTAAHTRAQAEAALAASCMQVVGISSDSGNTCSATADLTAFATATGARVPPSAWDADTRPAGCAANQCCTSVNGAGVATDADGLCPLVFRTDSNGTGLGANAAFNVTAVRRFAGREITIALVGETASLDGTPLPSGTTADFLESLTATSFVEPAEPPALPDPTLAGAAFQGVAADTELTWTMSLANDVVAPAPTPRLYRLRAQALADGCLVADEHTIYVFVPRTATAR